MKEKNFQEQIDRYYQLWFGATQFYESWSKQRGITYNAVLTLCTLLSNKEYCTQKMICDQWRLPKQTVNTILKDFEAKGYVIFSTLAADKRNKLISFTADGEKYADKISAELYSLDYYAVEKMGLERMRELNRNLEQYLAYCHEAQTDNDSK